MSITIKETIVGSGEQWFMQEVQDRQKWLDENVEEGTYKAWYSSLRSDDRYIQFLNEEDAIAYKIMWVKEV